MIADNDCDNGLSLWEFTNGLVDDLVNCGCTDFHQHINMIFCEKMVETTGSKSVILQQAR